MIHYWQPEGDQRVNFGDYIGPYIYERLCQGVTLTDDEVFISVGTYIQDTVLKSYDNKRKIIWGSGIGYNSRVDKNKIRQYNDLEIHLVRGPLTARQLDIDVHMGDPALLMPIFIKRRYQKNKVLYIPHWKTFDVVSNIYELHNLVKADQVLCPLVYPGQFEGLIDEIASASFVLTNSLHGAIIAQAYNVPWAPCRTRREHRPDSTKWQDWLMYLDIQGLPEFTSDYQGGLTWWNKYKNKIQKPRIEEIISSFPFPEMERNLLALVGYKGF